MGCLLWGYPKPIAPLWRITVNLDNDEKPQRRQGIIQSDGDQINFSTCEAQGRKRCEMIVYNTPREKQMLLKSNFI